MRDHLKLLGILNIVWSSISLLIGLVVLLVFGGLAGFLAATGMSPVSWNDNSGGLIVAPFMALIGFGIVLLICVLSLPAFIGGIGLLKLKSWSRILMIVISIFHLFSFPIGSALGVYGLWVLFQPEAKQILDGGTALSVPLDRPGPPLTSV
jgi:hypothetical protein